MSHMPTDEQPGVNALLLQDDGIDVDGGPFTTIDFTGDGIQIIDAGDGIAQVIVTSNVNSSMPWVDLRLAPYSIVANDAAYKALNTAGVKAAIAAYATTGARLMLPAGRIYFDQDATTHDSIVFSGKSNFALVGQGMFVTTLVMQGTGNSGEWALIKVSEGSSKIEIAHLGVEEGTVTNEDPGKNMYGITVRNIASTTPTRLVDIHHVFLGYFRGDAVQFFGNVGASDNIWVEHCKLSHFYSIGGSTLLLPDAGSRSCVAFQRGFRDIEVSHFYVEGARNSEIDFEPTGISHPFPMDSFSIHDGYVKHLGNTDVAVSLAGVVGGAVTPGAQVTRSRFSDITIIDGELALTCLDECDLTNVVVYCTGGGAFAGKTAPLVDVLANCWNITFTNLRAYREATCADAHVVEVGDSNSNYPKNVVFNGGRIYQGTTATAVLVNSCNGVRFGMGLVIEMADAVLTSCAGILIASQNQNVVGQVVDDVYIQNTGGGTLPIGIWYNANNSKTMRGLRTTNVRFVGTVTTGVRYDVSDSTTTMEPYPVLQGCDFTNCTNTWLAINGAAALVYPVVSGNPKGVCGHVGSGTPEAFVTAKIGCTYQRLDGGANTTLYVKETGTGNTGWVGK